MSPTRRFDARSAARAGVIAAWAAFFGYLFFSGEVTRYLGPRTEWVVTFGLIVLGLAAIAHVGALSGAAQSRLTVREALGYVVVVLPIAAVIMVPAAELGSLAASKKAPGSGGLASAIAFAPPQAGDRVLSQIDIHYASLSDSFAQEAGIFDGMPLEVTGFVTHNDGTPGDFRLTRFYISCCAADAIPYSVPIDATGRDFDDDTWVRAAGTLRDTPDGFVLVPDSIEPIATPDDPYL